MLIPHNSIQQVILGGVRPGKERCMSLIDSLGVTISLVVAAQNNRLEQQPLSNIPILIC